MRKTSFIVVVTKRLCPSPSVFPRKNQFFPRVREQMRGQSIHWRSESSKWPTVLQTSISLPKSLVFHCKLVLFLKFSLWNLKPFPMKKGWGPRFPMRQKRRGIMKIPGSREQNLFFLSGQKNRGARTRPAAKSKDQNKKERRSNGTRSRPILHHCTYSTAPVKGLRKQRRTKNDVRTQGEPVPTWLPKRREQRNITSPTKKKPECLWHSGF